jgi:flagellar biosynthesis component FlhA
MKKLEIMIALSIIISVICLIASFKTKNLLDSKFYTSVVIVLTAINFKQLNQQRK